MADKPNTTTAPEIPPLSVEEMVGQIKAIANGLAAFGNTETPSELDRSAVGQFGEVIYEIAVRVEKRLRSEGERAGYAEERKKAPSNVDLEGTICDVRNLVLVARRLFGDMHNFQTWAPEASKDELQREDDKFEKALCVLSSAEDKAIELHDTFFGNTAEAMVRS